MTNTQKSRMIILISLSLIATAALSQPASICGVPFQCNTDFVVQNNSQTTCVTNLFYPYPPGAININSCGQNYTCYSAQLSSANPFTNSSLNFALSDGQCVLNPCLPQVKENNGFCYNNGDCETNFCNLTTNVCQTLGLGQTCLIGKDQCGQGLVCFSANQGFTGICQNILPANAQCNVTVSASNSYQLCAAGTACAYNDTTQKTGPFCLAAFSQPANSFVKLAVTSIQSLTASMLCQTYQVNSTNFCLAKAETLNSTVRTCKTDTDCVSNLGTAGNCNCDNPNQNGQAYCQGFYGDSIYTSIFTQFYNEVQSFLGNMSTCSMYQYQSGSGNCVMPNGTATVNAYNFQNINFAGVDNGLEAFDIPNFGSGDTIAKGQCPVYLIESLSSTNFTQCRFFDNAANTVHLAECLPQYACENQYMYPSVPLKTVDCQGNTQVSETKTSVKAQKTAVKRVLESINPTPNFQSTQYCYRNGPLGTEPTQQKTGYPSGNFLNLGQECVAQQNQAGNQWQTDCITNSCGNVNGTGVGTCQVLGNGANCTSSVQCGLGSMCNVGLKQPQCQAMLQVGSSCDNVTFSLCPPNSQCALLMNSSQPYTFSCQYLYSVPGGSAFQLILPNGVGQQGIIVTPATKQTPSQQIAFNQVCETGSFDFSNQVCYTDYEKSMLNPGQLFPPTCTQDFDCQSTYGNQGSCSCTPNTEGLQFCQGFFGDYEYNIIQFNQYTSKVLATDYTKVYPFDALLSNATVMNSNNIAGLADFTSNMPYLWTNFTNVPVQYQGLCYNSISSLQFSSHFLPYSLQVSQSTQDLRQNVDQLPYNLTMFKPYPNSTANCTKYQCKSSSANFTTASCMNINTDYNHTFGNIGNLEIDVQTCLYSYTCYSSFIAQSNDLFMTSNSTNPALGYYAYEGQCILNNNQAKRTPADKVQQSSSTWCYRDTDCITNTCVNNTCMMKKQNDTCDLQQAQCGANMTCFLSKCTNILSVGATCSANLDNTNYQLCPQGTICVTFSTDSKAKSTTTCQQLFSLPVNSTNIQIIGQNILPVQYLCQFGQFEDSNSSCIYPDKTKGGFPMACTSNQDCVGVNGTIGYCNCDTPTQDGQAYCKGFPGDKPYQTLIDNTRKAIQTYLKKSDQCAEYMSLQQYTGNMKKQCTSVDLSNFTSPVQNGYVSGPAVPQCLINAGINFPSTDGGVLQGNTANPTKLCPAYQCNQQLVNDSSNTYCRYQQLNWQNYTNQWFIAACPENYECVPFNNTNSIGNQYYKYCVKNGPYFNSIIPYGGLCSLLNNIDQSSLDCLTEVCLNQETNYQGYGICGVLGINQTCNSDIQCGKGMKCYNHEVTVNNVSKMISTCEYTLQIGEACNASSYMQCPHQSACIMKQYYVYDDTTVYTCQSFYSQPNNANFSMIINGNIVRQPVVDQNINTKQYFDQMCQSGSFNSTLLSCNPYLEYSINVPPIQCTSDNDCLGIWGTLGSCECFPNTEGYKYCKLLPGDLQLYINYYNKLVNYAQQNFSNCFPYEYLYPGQGKNVSNGGCYAQSAQSYYDQLQQVYTPVDPQYIPGCFKSQFWNYGFQTFQFSHAAKLFISSIFVIILTFVVLFI